jgi:hypothetical protein
MRKTLLPWLAAQGLFFFGVAAGAQDRDDPELARALARRGWFDEAEELCEKWARNAGTPAELRAQVPLLRAEIESERADRERDPQQAQERLDRSAELYRAFLKENPSHPSVLDARVSLGWLQARKARMLSDWLEVESNPERVTELRQKAFALYAQAQKYYETMLADLKQEKASPARENAQVDASLELPRSMIDHARVQGLDPESKRALLRQAIVLLRDFQMDQSDKPIAFEAMLEEGRSLLELGEYRQAEVKLRDTAVLKRRLAEFKMPRNDYHNRIIWGAQVALAMTLNRSGKSKDVKAFVEQVFKEERGIESRWAGLALRLEIADAFVRQGDRGQAIQVAREIRSIDAGGRFGLLADLLIRRLSSQDLRHLSPSDALDLADTAIDRADQHDALVWLRRVIEAARTAQDIEKFVPVAHYRMGHTFQQMKRNYEAIVAYEKVFTQFPGHELAPKACFEAARCYGTEFLVSGDPRDEEGKKKCLYRIVDKWPKDPVARNLIIMKAEDAQKAGELRKAAELYLQTPEDAEAYEFSLLEGAHCYRLGASRKWDAKPRLPAAEQEVRLDLGRAEEALRKLLARPSAPANQAPELARARPMLLSAAVQELAIICLHESMGRAQEGLKLLNQAAQDLPPKDPKLARIWGTQIQAHLALGQLESAVTVLDALYDRFPDNPALATACKSVAVRLHKAVSEELEKKGDEAKIADGLRRMSKYYTKWVALAPEMGMPVTVDDMATVAAQLYQAAKRLNGMDDSVLSFLDLKGRPLAFPQYWDDAAFVTTVLLEKASLKPEERLQVMGRLARCRSFLAKDRVNWDKAKEAYDRIIKEYKLIDASGRIDVSAATKTRGLLGFYVELGQVYVALGRLGQKFQYDNAVGVFSNIVLATSPESEAWWTAKYVVLLSLFERGTGDDLKQARVGLDNLERNHPDFDGGKYGLKEKLLELKRKLHQVGGGGR